MDDMHLSARTYDRILKAGDERASDRGILRPGLQSGGRAALVTIAFLLQTLVSALGSTVITNSDLTALSTAVEAGGLVTLAFDGTITLT